MNILGPKLKPELAMDLARLVKSPEPPIAGRVVAVPRVGGLHHRYARQAA